MQEVLVRRRRLVQEGELIGQSEFCARTGVRERGFPQLLKTGSIFLVDVDGVGYVPAYLADRNLNRSRLQSICRILAPAAAIDKFLYLNSRRGSLGNLTPLESLDDDKAYAHLRRMARAYLAEGFITSVEIFDGEVNERGKTARPLYTASCEVDPRIPLWKRVGQALGQADVRNPGPYPQTSLATVFVTMSAETQAGLDKLAARLHVRTADGTAKAEIHLANTPPAVRSFKVERNRDVVEVVRQIVGQLHPKIARKHRSSGPGELQSR